MDDESHNTIIPNHHYYRPPWTSWFFYKAVLSLAVVQPEDLLFKFTPARERGSTINHLAVTRWLRTTYQHIVETIIYIRGKIDSERWERKSSDCRKEVSINPGNVSADTFRQCRLAWERFLAGDLASDNHFHLCHHHHHRHSVIVGFGSVDSYLILLPGALI